MRLLTASTERPIPEVEAEVVRPAPHMIPLSLDDILSELDRFGKVGQDRDYMSGQFTCEVMTKILESTCFVKGFGTTRLIAANECLRKYHHLKMAEREFK